MHRGCSAPAQREIRSMISIEKVRDADYYLAETHADDIHEYYAGNDRVGEWTGSFAEQRGLTGAVDPADFHALISGIDPATGKRLTETATRVPAFDLTISVDKGSSIVRGLGDDETRQVFDEAFDEARRDVIAFLEERGVGVRRGHAGAERHDAPGLMAAVFHHHHSRESDPQEHLHIVMMNAAEGPDGRVTGLDSLRLYSMRYTAEAVFQASFRNQMAQRLGVAYGDVDRHGVAQVAGIPEAVRAEFSQRRAQIIEALAERGNRSANAARIAALATRKAKGEPVPDDVVQADWRQRAIKLDFSVDDIPRFVRTPKLDATDDKLAFAVTENRSTFGELEAIRQTAIAATDGASYAQVAERAEQFLDSDHAVAIADGRWSTREILDLENAAVEIATQSPTTAPAVSPHAVAKAIDERPTMGADQTELVETIATSGREVDVVVGKAGAGKTFALDALRSAFEAEDTRVIGAALAARAAHELQSGAGIRSTTAHSLIGAIDRGQLSMNDRTVLVIDEAGMLPTRQLSRLLTEAHAAGAKTVLVGDPKQLPEIEAGGLFAAIARRVPAVHLTENRRQTDPFEREALDALRLGDIDAALGGLQQSENVTVATTADGARTALVADWYGAQKTGTAVMVASRRSDAVDLNGRARALLIGDGHLGEPVLEHSGSEYRIGDRILTHANRYDLGLINGMTGTVTGANDLGLIVDLTADNRRALVPTEYIDDGNLTHGYALTIHKAQGMTVDHSFVLGDDSIYAEMGYTGLTRGRHANRLYIVASRDQTNRPALDPLADIRRSLGVSRAQTAAIDTITTPGGNL